MQVSHRQRLRTSMQRFGIGQAVQDRVIRLNPDWEPGLIVRGWHPTRTARRSIERDVVSRPHFEKRWGKGSASRLPEEAFVQAGGKRRWISGLAYVEGPPA